jgi:hypothetical protein
MYYSPDPITNRYKSTHRVRTESSCDYLYLDAEITDKLKNVDEKVRSEGNVYVLYREDRILSYQDHMPELRTVHEKACELVSGKLKEEYCNVIEFLNDINDLSRNFITGLYRINYTIEKDSIKLHILHDDYGNAFNMSDIYKITC